MKLNNETKKVISDRVKEKGELRTIHAAFDPQNMAMPQYSSKYANESNVGAFRHLAGGRQESGYTGNSADLKSSNLHWMMGLRSYNPKKDLSLKG